MLEISARYLIDPATDKERRFSWGIPATNERVDGRFRVSQTANCFRLISLKLMERLKGIRIPGS